MVQNVEQRESGVGEKQIPETREKTRVPEHSMEVEGWVEKVERKQSGTQKQQTDTQDDTRAVVVQPRSDQPAVTLPVTQDDVQKGKKMPVTAAFRWLVEWVVRQVKKYQGRVVYREPVAEEVQEPETSQGA